MFSFLFTIFAENINHKDMQAVLLVIIVIGGLFLLTRLSRHSEVKKEGGIRTKYNKIFSYIYNLPNARIVFENASYVKIEAKDSRRSLSFTLNYAVTLFEIKCKVSYFDDTPFPNGKTLEWSMSEKWSNEDSTLNKIKKDIESLP